MSYYTVSHPSVPRTHEILAMLNIIYLISTRFFVCVCFDHFGIWIGMTIPPSTTLYHPSTIPLPSLYHPSTIPLPPDPPSTIPLPSLYHPSTIPLPSLYHPLPPSTIPLPSLYHPSTIPLPSLLHPYVMLKHAKTIVVSELFFEYIYIYIYIYMAMKYFNTSVHTKCIHTTNHARPICD